MRIAIGLLSGVVGMLAGWFGLAFLVIALAGPDRDGGVAMGAFFNIGPLGALIGFGVGIWLFVKFGLVTQGPAPAIAPPSEPVSASPCRCGRPGDKLNCPSLRGHCFGDRRGSRVVGVVRADTIALSDARRYDFLLQFRLPADMAAPADVKDVEIVLDEAGQRWPAYLNEAGWRGHQGNRVVILATVAMSYKTSRRVVTLSMPGAPSQSWPLDLSSDPDPTPGYTAWLASRDAPNPIELNYRLTADR